MSNSDTMTFVCPCGECDSILEIDLRERRMGITNSDGIEIAFQWPFPYPCESSEKNDRAIVRQGHVLIVWENENYLSVLTSDEINAALDMLGINKE